MTSQAVFSRRCSLLATCVDSLTRSAADVRDAAGRCVASMSLAERLRCRRTTGHCSSSQCLVSTLHNPLGSHVP